MDACTHEMRTRNNCSAKGNRIKKKGKGGQERQIQGSLYDWVDPAPSNQWLANHRYKLNGQEHVKKKLVKPSALDPILSDFFSRESTRENVYFDGDVGRDVRTAYTRYAINV